MSTLHYVHHVIEMGPPGDGISPAEAAAMRADLDTSRRHVAAVPIVSADWFSNPNDAAIAAGPGGRVGFSNDVTYDLPEPLRVLTNQTVEGCGNRTILKYAGEAIIQAASPTSQSNWATVRNLMLHGDNAGEVGLDARYFTRSLFENVNIRWTTKAGVSFGGDQSGDIGGWSNTLIKGEVYAPANGAAFLFAGTTGSGARTANNNTVQDVIVNLTEDATSIGFHLVAGDTNKILGCDVGYSGGDAIPFLLESGARGNRIAFNRTEGVNRDVIINGAIENDFALNWFTSRHATY